MVAPVKTVDIRLRNLNTTDFLIDFAFFLSNLYKKAGFDFLHAGYFPSILSSAFFIGTTPVSNSLDSDHPDKMLGQM